MVHVCLLSKTDNCTQEHIWIHSLCTVSNTIQWHSTFMLNKPFRVKIYKYKLCRKIYIRSEAAKCCLRHPKAEYKGNMDALSSAEILVFNTHEIMIPLSIEKLSDGRPAMVHERIFTGSPREFIRDMLGEHGISLLLQRFIHSSVWSCRGVHSLVMTSFSPDYYEHLNCKDSCKKIIKNNNMAYGMTVRLKRQNHNSFTLLHSFFQHHNGPLCAKDDL